MIVGDSTSVCLYKLAQAALDLRAGRDQIVTDLGNFPTDRYVLEGIARERGARARVAGVRAIVDALAPLLSERTALVSFSHVAYRDAFVADMAALTRTAHEAGALTLWDLSHAVGSVRVELDADGADFASGAPTST